MKISKKRKSPIFREQAAPSLSVNPRKRKLAAGLAGNKSKLVKSLDPVSGFTTIVRSTSKKVEATSGQPSPVASPLTTTDTQDLTTNQVDNAGEPVQSPDQTSGAKRRRRRNKRSNKAISDKPAAVTVKPNAVKGS